MACTSTKRVIKTYYSSRRVRMGRKNPQTHPKNNGRVRKNSAAFSNASKTRRKRKRVEKEENASKEKRTRPCIRTTFKNTSRRKKTRPKDLDESKSSEEESDKPQAADESTSPREEANESLREEANVSPREEVYTYTHTRLRELRLRNSRRKEAMRA